MYQALSRFTVLQATGSWAGAWERGYTKDVTLKVGGGVGQGLATDVTHLRLNQPPSI